MAGEAKFEIGEIVKLKSGGPNMTVTGVDNGIEGISGATVECSWFGGRKLERGRFPPRAIEHSKPETAKKAEK